MADIKQLLSDEKQRLDGDDLVSHLDQQDDQGNEQRRQQGDRLRKAREQYIQALDAYQGTL
jgi:hypothetical protein